MRTRPRKLRMVLAAVTVGAAIAVSGLVIGGASSHREAPLISEDPVADNTDTYAFVSPDRPDTVTLVANWIPFELPAGGPNFNKFGDDVLYKINVDNDGDATADVVYEWRFKTTVANPDTFLYNTGPVESLDDEDLNVKQTYTLTEVRDGERTKLVKNAPVAPANIGPRSTPNYDQLAAEATVEASGGVQSFAGPRDDPFFVDLGAVFDLLGNRPLNEAHVAPLPNAPGQDDVAGFNVHSVVLQVPSDSLVDGDPVIGVWSTTERRTDRVFGDGKIENSGDFTQVSRLGMPLVNEVVAPLGAKDAFNASKPADDAQFLPAVEEPEVAGLIPQLYPGVTVPEGPRDDIVTIFLTGIPDVNQPEDVTPSEMIRLNTSIAPTPLDQQDRLGLLAGQNDGFPNGRRLVDDVYDIELRALAGGTPFTPDFDRVPNNALTDGVDANDLPFLASFPYLSSPHQGYGSNL
ncbi:MAG: DUF4331 domain-containing protein [Acidimicrobiia bacterium]